MRYRCLFALILLLNACNQETKKTSDASADSSNLHNQPAVKDSLQVVATDTSLLPVSRDILKALKQKDFTTLAGFIHPVWQLRFSPYGYIDTSTSQLLSPYELLAAAKKSSVLKWGSYDGSGEPIVMNIHNYIDKFVYNKDYLNAPQTSSNRFLASGNSINNLKEVFPGADFTEFYFPGFDAKYAGMDWETLRLAFRRENNKVYLIAIVHDKWTI